MVKNIIEVFSHNIKKNTVELSNVFSSYYPINLPGCVQTCQHRGQAIPVLKNGNKF